MNAPEHMMVAQLIAMLQEMPGDDLVSLATFTASGILEDYYIIEDIEQCVWDEPGGEVNCVLFTIKKE